MAFLPRTVVVLLLFITPLAFAQTPPWEIGGAGGYAIAKKNSVVSAGQSANAGLTNGYLASAVAVNHMWQHLSGEIRYVYRKGSPMVESGGTKAKLTGEAHSVGYDLLIHTSSKESTVRPYFAFGGGVKVFRGVGSETDFQPLQEFVVLTKTQEIQPMFSIGGGVSIRLAPYAVIRLDFRDQVTAFPQKVIFPAPGAELNGFLHDFLPMAGIGLTF